jgi:hypothetical protein
VADAAQSSAGSFAVSVVVGRLAVVAVAVTTADRQVSNGHAQLATAVAGCMCAITSVTAVAECMCVAVAVEFTIVAIAGAAVAAHAYLMICRSRRQSCITSACSRGS